MIRSLRGKLVRVSIKNGQFIISPLKKAYREYKETLPRLAYDAWATQNEEQCFVEGEWIDGPSISLLVPAYNPEPTHFLAMVYSVVNQHYPEWELIIVNASSDPVSRRQIDEVANIDRRIRVISPPQQQGISANTNAALEAASGEFVAFLDHDDLLHPCALHAMAATVKETGAELLYSDEDKIKADSSAYFEPFLKPGWSPDLLMNVNYINHLTVMRKAFVDKVGGLRAECDGAQDYDLLLRVIDACRPKIVHVARVLYHWRAAATSTAADFATKSYVLRAGERALQEHLERNGLEGSVHAIKTRPGFYETEFALPKSLSLVIGPIAAANRRLCVAWLEQVVRELKGFGSIELVCGDWIEEYREQLPHLTLRVVHAAADYWPQAAEAVTHPVVLCLNVGALPESPGAVAAIVGRAYRLDRVVSPFILSQGRHIVDAGLVEAPFGFQRLFRESRYGRPTPYGSTEWTRNVAALTGNVFAARRETFMSLVKTAKRSLPAPLRPETGHACVADGLACWTFKGLLVFPPLYSDDYGNPQLTQAHAPSIRVQMSSWGMIRQRSEREEDD